MRGEEGKALRDTGMWGQSIGTVDWDAAIAHGVPKPLARFMEEKLPRAIKSTATSDSKSVNEQILRGRENEQGKEHCVLC